MGGYPYGYDILIALIVVGLIGFVPGFILGALIF